MESLSYSENTSSNSQSITLCLKFKGALTQEPGQFVFRPSELIWHNKLDRIMQCLSITIQNPFESHGRNALHNLGLTQIPL